MERVAKPLVSPLMPVPQCLSLVSAILYKKSTLNIGFNDGIFVYIFMHAIYAFMQVNEYKLSG